ncbi:MAG: hypothetical protein P1U57_11325, partial [Oleibacter sp.]|nr:hypothetical protein [Thalassolituus sp.]
GDVSNPDNPYLNVQYLKRASWAGVPTGRRFQADPGVLALGLISLDSVLALVAVADECQVTGTPGCFSLTNYQSIYVGEAPSETDPNGQTASGVFVSLQTSEVPWSDLSGLGGSNRVLTERGAYLNSTQFKDSNGVIRYPLTLDFVDATSGTQRVATCVGRLKGC